MRSEIRHAVLVAVALALPAVPATAQRGAGVDATTPPVPKSGLRLPDIQLHDPWMLADKSTQTYYLYSAASRRVTGESRTGTLYYKSKDLATWVGPFIAFVAPA